MVDLRYPIGRFEPVEAVTKDLRDSWIQQIAGAPAQLRTAVEGLSQTHLDTPYRPEGWTIRQVVHHLPDSHMNSYIRFKLALTEERPVIKPYQEHLWAQLEDSHRTPIEVSLALLDALHTRWVTLLSRLSDEDWSRTFTNPESDDTVTLGTAVGLYAWHGRHHVAHITTLRERMGW